LKLAILKCNWPIELIKDGEKALREQSTSFLVYKQSRSFFLRNSRYLKISYIGFFTDITWMYTWFREIAIFAAASNTHVWIPVHHSRSLISLGLNIRVKTSWVPLSLFTRTEKASRMVALRLTMTLRETTCMHYIVLFHIIFHMRNLDTPIPANHLVIKWVPGYLSNI